MTALPAAEEALTVPSRRHLALWTFTSQGLSSATNAGFTVVLARSVDQDVFGAFAVAFSVFMFVIGLVRAGVSTPLLIANSSSTRSVHRGAALDSAGASVAAGLVSLAGCLVAAGVSWAAGAGALAEALAVMGAALPGLLLQDAWRQALFSAGRPRAAAANDGLWLLVQAAATALALVVGAGTTGWLMLCWALGAAAGALLGVRQLQGWPRPGRALAWVRLHRPANGRLSAEYLLNMGAVNLANFLLGGVAGLAATGAIRASQTVLGPLQTLFSAVSSFSLPVAARHVDAGQTGPLARLGAVLAVVNAGVAALGVAVLLLLPDAWGVQLLGDTWQGAQPVLLPTGLLFVALGAAVGPAVVLRALSRVDLLLRVAAVQAPGMLAGGVVGGVLGGAEGAAWGFFAAQAVGSAVTVVMLGRALRARRASA